MEPNPLNIEVRTQRDGIETDRENNVPITQASGNVIPPCCIIQKSFKRIIGISI